MTLLVNEIHLNRNLLNSAILLVEDRRISNARTGKRICDSKKLFKIPYLNACVGYFGLAEANQNESMSSWLANFITNSSQKNTMDLFSEHLCAELNSQIPKSFCLAGPSGFHICGYNEMNFPAMKYISNIESMNGNYYEGFRKEYLLSEEFLDGPAKAMGFDGEHPELIGDYIQYFINGDVRSFHAVWKSLDNFVEEMLGQQDISTKSGEENLKQIAVWKMKVIGSYYQKFEKRKIIGGKPDVFVLKPKMKEENG